MTASMNIFDDTFQRVAANLGPNYTNKQNGFATNNNAKGTFPATTSNNAAIQSAETFSGSSEITVKFSALNSTIDTLGVLFRYSESAGVASFYVFTMNDSAAAIGKLTGVNVGGSNLGTFTVLAALTAPNVAGDEFTIRTIGNTIIVFKNGIDTVPILQVSDNTWTEGPVGVYQFGNTATFEEFSVTNMIPSAGITKQVVCDGDSITMGAGILIPWPNSLSPDGIWNSANLGVSAKGLGIEVTYSIPSLSGVAMKSMIETGPDIVDSLFDSSFSENVLIAWGGTNDISSGRTAAQVYADLKTYCSARRSQGWKIITAPLLSCSVNDSVHQDFNALLQADHSFVDVLISLPDTLIANGAFSNPTFFQSDGIHPTQFSATTIISPAFSGAINEASINQPVVNFFS